MLKSIALPGTFCIKEEGRRTFIFKEGYKDLVTGSTKGHLGNNPPEGDERLEERGTAHRTHTATWTVAPPGILTVSSQASTGATQPVKKTVEGRAEHPCIPLEGGGAAIIRRVRHGGLWGKVMGDMLWGVGRPVQELINTTKALERGVPTAEILGVRLEAAGPLPTGPLYRADVFSKELAGTIDLLQLLSWNTPLTQSMDSKKREIIRAVALSVRAMHEAGLHHNDLHLKNILITREAPFKAYIIDLDKSSLHESLPLDQRIKNLLRLDRSAEKFMAVGTTRRVAPTCLITRRDKLRFLRDYMGGKPDWKELARGLNPDHALHRWWWKINKKL